jgi:NADH:ubiquinone oxidoreductase subunit K
MLMIIAGVIGAMGLISVVFRRTLLGLLIGIQLMFLGATMMFVLSGIFASAGVSSESLPRVHGQVGGLLIALGAVGQLAAGFSLAIRQFYLKNRTEMDDLRSLKH